MTIDSATERRSRPARAPGRGHAAGAARVLTAGMSASVAVGLIAAMGRGGDGSASSSPPVAPPAQPASPSAQPVVVLVQTADGVRLAEATIDGTTVTQVTRDRPPVVRTALRPTTSSRAS